MKHIYTIDKDGTVTIEVKGVNGPACSEQTKKVEEALGIVKDDELTGDYYKKEIKKITH